MMTTARVWANAILLPGAETFTGRRWYWIHKEWPPRPVVKGLLLRPFRSKQLNSYLRVTSTLLWIRYSAQPGVKRQTATHQTCSMANFVTPTTLNLWLNTNSVAVEAPNQGLLRHLKWSLKAISLSLRIIRQNYQRTWKRLSPMV